MKSSYKTRIACCAAALLCCAPLMQSCGKEDSPAAQTAGSSADQMLEEITKDAVSGAEGGSDSETGSETGSVSGFSDESSTNADTKPAGQTVKNGDTEYVKADPASPDCAEATERLNKYFDAMKSGDVDAVFDVMDMQKTLAYMKQMYDAQGGSELDTERNTVEELEKQMRQSVQESVNHSLSNTIVGVYEVPGYRTQIDEMLAEMDENIEEIRNSDDSSKQEMLSKYEEQIKVTRDMLNFESLLFFDCDVTADGKTEETPLVMVKRDGKWYLEMTFMPAMIGYVKKSKIVSANSGAKSCYAALQSALTDMEDEDHDAASLDGTYTLKGSDFENVKQPERVETEEEKMQYLRCRIHEYFNDITKYEQVAFVIENGDCSCAALDCGKLSTLRDGEIELFGTYPNMTSTDTYNTIGSISDALKFADPNSDR